MPRLKNTHRFRSSIYLIIKLYTLRTQTPRTKLIQTEENPPFLSPWKGHSEPIHSKKSKLGKRGHLEAMDIKWKNPQVGLRQNSSWVGIWEFGVVQKFTGKLGQTQTWLPRDDSSQRRGLQLMAHTQHVVCFVN